MPEVTQPLTATDFDPYADGYEAAESGLERSDNPHRVCTPAYALWDAGYVERANS